MCVNLLIHWFLITRVRRFRIMFRVRGVLSFCFVLRICCLLRCNYDFVSKATCLSLLVSLNYNTDIRLYLNRPLREGILIFFWKIGLPSWPLGFHQSTCTRIFLRSREPTLVCLSHVNGEQRTHNVSLACQRCHHGCCRIGQRFGVAAKQSKTYPRVLRHTGLCCTDFMNG